MKDIEYVNRAPEHTSKETIICENCQHINIIKIKGRSTREKRGHMLYCDDITWIKIMRAVQGFGNVANYLTFMLKLYEEQKHTLNVSDMQSVYTEYE